MGDFLLKLFSRLLVSASPTIKGFLKQLMDNLEAKAKATDNPIDDILVDLLKIILNIE